MPLDIFPRRRINSKFCDNTCVVRMGARRKRKLKMYMYKIVWAGTEVEPVVGFRTNSRENAQKLVDAWGMNFDSKLEVKVVKA